MKTQATNEFIEIFNELEYALGLNRDSYDSNF